MAKIKIDKIKCKGCQLCVLYCANKYIVLDKHINKRGIYPVTVSDDAKCTGCSFCVLVCPDSCIEVSKDE